MKVLAIVSMIGIGTIIEAHLRKIDSTHGSVEASVFFADGSSISKSVADNVSIAPGELPGYTGWARPAYTLAGHFEVVDSPAFSVDPNDFVMILTCRHEDCRRGGAKFYVRAYGPSVVAGRVKDHGNGNYDIAWPIGKEKGPFTLEVVLAFSATPRFHEYPLDEDPGYEGHLIPGFPVTVISNTTNPAPARFCQVKDVFVVSSEGGYNNGRWVVVDRVSNRARLQTNSSREISLQGYQNGGNALGIFMRYKPYDCQIFSWLGQVKRLFRSCNIPRKPVHVIFIGDSVMRMQAKAFKEAALNNFRVTSINAHSGLRRVLPNVTAALLDIAWGDHTEDRIIVFNSGLHDIKSLCNQRLFPKSMDENYSCSDDYRSLLTELVKLVASLPARLRVFQTTTAAWMKYGNFGFAWPPDKTQPFSLSTSFVEHFNEIAFSVIAPFSSVHIVDAYWITLARPDNREVDINNFAGRHLVHPGREVLNAIVMIWMTSFASTLDSECFDISSQLYLRPA